MKKSFLWYFSILFLPLLLFTPLASLIQQTINYLLTVATEFALVSYAVVAGIGIMQGIILGKAIMQRFPYVQNHSRFSSIALSVLFGTNSLISTMKFAQPEKIDLSALSTITSEKFLASILQMIGLNVGYGSIVFFSITVTILLLLKVAKLRGVSRVFVLAISILIVPITIVLRLSDYKPDTFQIFLYMLYQVGITAGIMWATGRKIEHAQESEVS